MTQPISFVRVNSNFTNGGIFLEEMIDSAESKEKLSHQIVIHQ